MTVEAQRSRTPVHSGQLVGLRDLGLNEHWLQDWLVEDLTRVGLGALTLVEQEQSQSGGGNLDILAAAADTYCIEVQLGEVDASHGFRVFDYWARNRRRFPNPRRRTRRREHDRPLPGRPGGAVHIRSLARRRTAVLARRAGGRSGTRAGRPQRQRGRQRHTAGRHHR